MLILLILLILFLPVLIVQKNQEALAKKKRSLEQLKAELAKVEIIILQTTTRINELDAIIKRRFLWARVILMAILFGVNFSIIKAMGFTEGISVVTDINTFLLFLVLSSNFILFGKIIDLEQLTERFEMAIRNYTYRKDLNIKSNLLAYHNQRQEISSMVEELKREIAQLETQQSV